MLHRKLVLTALGIALYVVSPTAHASNVEAFFGYKRDLELSIEDEFLTNPDERRKSDGAFMGIAVYHTSEYYTLNAIITNDTSNPQEAIVKSLSLTKDFSLGRNSGLTLTVGNVVIPYGLFEMQRIFPTVTTPPSLNSTFFGEYVSTSVLKESNNGLIIRGYKNNHSLALALYAPSERLELVTTSDFRRFKFRNDNIAGIEVPIAEINLSNVNSRPNRQADGSAGDPTGQPVEVSSFDIDVKKYSAFLQYTYDNRDNIIIDVEYLGSRSSIESLDLKNGREQGLYVAGQYLSGQSMYLAEAYAFVSSGIVEFDLTGYSATYSYDMSDYLFYTNTAVLNGSLFSTAEASIGLVYNLFDNAFIRVQYKSISGTIRDVSYEQRTTNCFNNPLTLIDECRDINPQGTTTTQVTVNEREFSGSGLEARFIMYF